MGVFKRPAKAKKGQKQYWYMRCQHKGREYWESTGKRVGEITKDEALRMFPDWKDEIKTGIKKSPKQEQSSEQVVLLPFSQVKFKLDLGILKLNKKGSRSSPISYNLNC